MVLPSLPAHHRTFSTMPVLGFKVLQCLRKSWIHHLGSQEPDPALHNCTTTGEPESCPAVLYNEREIQLTQNYGLLPLSPERSSTSNCIHHCCCPVVFVIFEDIPPLGWLLAPKLEFICLYLNGSCVLFCFYPKGRPNTVSIKKGWWFGQFNRYPLDNGTGGTGLHVSSSR